MRRGDTGRGDVGRVVVVVPTYDEAQTLPGLVARLRAAVPEADVLVVDDASPDGTGDVADALAAADPQVRVRHRAGKEGLGRAYVDAFGFALEQGYDVVVECDADGSHRPEELRRLLAALRDADLVLGSRWVPGGQVLRWPRSRRWLSRGGTTVVRLALRLPLADATGGYRAFRADLLRRLGLEEVVSAGYCFQVDLAVRAVAAGARVVEVPITFEERTAGRSKMDTSIIVEALARVLWWSVTGRRLPRTGVGEVTGS